MIPHPNKFLPCHRNLHLFFFNTRHKKGNATSRNNNNNNKTINKNKQPPGSFHWGGDDAHGRYYRIVAFIVLLMATWLGLFLALSLLYPWQDGVATGRFCFSMKLPWEGIFFCRLILVGILASMFFFCWFTTNLSLLGMLFHVDLYFSKGWLNHHLASLFGNMEGPK